MTIGELITRLEKYDPNMIVCIREFYSMEGIDLFEVEEIWQVSAEEFNRFEEVHLEDKNITKDNYNKQIIIIE